MPRLARMLRPGDPLVLMGPNGIPSEDDLAKGKTVMIIAQMWGVAVMLTLGKALRAAGKQVLLFSLSPNGNMIFHRDELEQSADQIVWCTQAEPAVEPRRPVDSAVVNADVIAMLKDYAADGRGIALKDVDSVMVMGATGVLRAMQQLARDDKESLFGPHTEVLGAVGSPMQCMLKGVCGQCLQWQVDPDTGERTRAVFSCAMQDQPLTWIDLDNMTDRLMQNRLADAMSGLWVDHVLERA